MGCYGIAAVGVTKGSANILGDEPRLTVAVDGANGMGLEIENDCGGGHDLLRF